MKKLVLFVFALFMCSVASAEFTLMTYNIRALRSGNEKVELYREEHVKPVVKVITKNNPDIVCLQEVDNGTQRSAGINQAELLGKETNMVATFAKAISLGTGEYGVAVLSKEKPMKVKRVQLPGIEPRVLLQVEFEKYVVFCTHLDLKQENRAESVGIILKEARAYTKPVFIAGDFNFHIDDAEAKELFSKTTLLTNPKAKTFPAHAPTECIDFVCLFSTTKFKVTSKVVRAPTESDHRPILVRLEK